MEENDSQNEPKIRSVGSYFSENVRNRKSVLGLRRRGRIAYEPIPWNAQGDPKIEDKKGHISEPLFLGEKYKKHEKWIPKGLQKGDSETGKTPLGAILGHFGAPSHFLTSKMSP